MKNQRGMSFIALVLVIALGISLLLVAIKIVPAYMEYFTIKKMLTAIAKEPNFATMTPQEIRASFERRSAIEYITAVEPGDLDIVNEGGKPVITAEYSKKVPLAFNLSAWMDFQASTAETKLAPKRTE